MAAENK